jgi:hypothetical protein
MTKDLFIDLNYRSGVSPSSCLHVRPNNELSSLMTNQHPITPPPELVQQWLGNHFGTTISGEVSDVELAIATQAARWGADQELEACITWLRANGYPGTAFELNDLRRPRPKPPSLKEQAQAELDRLIALIPTERALAMAEPIRQALEALPND